MAEYESERLFRVASFNPSHRQLIIRSEMERLTDPPTRVEIYFGNVEYMALKPIFRGIAVRRASHEEQADIGGRFGISDDARPDIFLLDAELPTSFVVSGKPSWREARRAIDEPSLFDFSQPWPPGPEMKWGHVD